MVLCIDFTYLLALHQTMVLHNARGIVGGSFALSDCQSATAECFYDVQQAEALQSSRSGRKANRMFPGDASVLGWFRLIQDALGCFRMF